MKARTEKKEKKKNQIKTRSPTTEFEAVVFSDKDPNNDVR